MTVEHLLEGDAPDVEEDGSELVVGLRDHWFQEPDLKPDSCWLSGQLNLFLTERLAVRTQRQDFSSQELAILVFMSDQELNAWTRGMRELK